MVISVSTFSKPQRRSISAIRDFPNGCGRPPTAASESTLSVVSDSKPRQLLNRRTVSAVRTFPKGCGSDRGHVGSGGMANGAHFDDLSDDEETLTEKKFPHDHRHLGIELTKKLSFAKDQVHADKKKLRNAKDEILVDKKKLLKVNDDIKIHKKIAVKNGGELDFDGRVIVQGLTAARCSRWTNDGSIRQRTPKKT